VLCGRDRGLHGSFGPLPLRRPARIVALEGFRRRSRRGATMLRSGVRARSRRVRAPARRRPGRGGRQVRAGIDDDDRSRLPRRAGRSRRCRLPLEGCDQCETGQDGATQIHRSMVPQAAYATEKPRRSEACNWWAILGSNQGPHAYQAPPRFAWPGASPLDPPPNSV
jgi:hypothetical protein